MKNKYPPRPFTDGDRWVEGYRHTKPRQGRSNPLSDISDVVGGVQINVGIDHTAQWRPLSDKSVLEMCVRGALTLLQLQTAIKRGVWSRSEFRVAFLKAIQEGTIAGTVKDPMAVFNKYRPALVGWS